uniref:Calaxin n=1 Tax=Kryptolebias marmoratus TaxID=37003 RepID=A0A3Q2ZK85_KRYMA
MSAMNRKIIKALAETISKKVEHNKTETECLIREFYVLLGEQVSPGKESHGLDKGRFRGILHSMFGMTNDMMMDGFRAFDKDSDGFISLEEWIEGLSVFLRGTLDEKIQCYRVYDLNADKYIAREEMFHMLKNSLFRLPTEEDPDEGVKDLVEIAMRRLQDTYHDGQVSVEEFDEAVKEENLMLEAFGTCLPDASSIEKFEQRVFQEQLEQ